MFTRHTKKQESSGPPKRTVYIVPLSNLILLSPERTIGPSPQAFDLARPNGALTRPIHGWL